VQKGGSMKKGNNILVRTLLAIAVLFLPLLSLAFEKDEFEITLKDRLAINEFVEKNEMFVNFEADFVLLNQEINAHAGWHKVSFNRNFLKKKGIPDDVECSSSVALDVDGDYIEPDNITKITIRKVHRRIGGKRTKFDYLFYEIEVFGKGWFKSYYVSVFKDRLDKPIECRDKNGNLVFFDNLRYPAYVEIPKGALVYNLQEVLKKSNSLEMDKIRLSMEKTIGVLI
jgi:hypothetical protein